MRSLVPTPGNGIRSLFIAWFLLKELEGEDYFSRVSVGTVVGLLVLVGEC